MNRELYNFESVHNIDKRIELVTIFDQQSMLGLVDDMSHRVSE
ncbi:hypothetical protein [Tepidibacter hydrothermalis]|uniref:Uncharacterized protein n=1 Tax=Tepidibacter hydrothermalis TaxID=3036126 RepID=A0ABY8ED06_9FIRM|nr:hypothetical protein [Tepidibacter hydrothermalis]WFD10666.1 hypothetical protein P4S50_00910 [Tepidibacter hydrothermalis]